MTASEKGLTQAWLVVEPLGSFGAGCEMTRRLYQLMIRQVIKQVGFPLIAPVARSREASASITLVICSLRPQSLSPKTKKSASMLASEVFAGAVMLGAVARPSLNMATSPKRSGLLGRQTGTCGTSAKPCADSCVPLTHVCCG